MVPIAVLIAAAATQPLTKLLDRCDEIAASHHVCGSDIYKPVWRRFESATGEIAKVDMASLEPAARSGVIAHVYVTPPGVVFDMRRLRQFFFDCRGQYADMEHTTEMMDAPPRAMVGMIADAVCRASEPARKARDARHRAALKDF